jgi:hypothetical protein
MTDEDIGTAAGNWVSNAEVKVMSAKLAATPEARTASAGSDGTGKSGISEIVFDQAGRFLAGPFAPGDPSMWAGLCLFDNESYALYGHDRQSWRLGPLEQLQSERAITHDRFE